MEVGRIAALGGAVSDVPSLEEIPQLQINKKKTQAADGHSPTMKTSALEAQCAGIWADLN